MSVIVVFSKKNMNCTSHAKGVEVDLAYVREATFEGRYVANWPSFAPDSRRRTIHLLRLVGQTRTRTYTLCPKRFDRSLCSKTLRLSYICWDTDPRETPYRSRHCGPTQIAAIATALSTRPSLSLAQSNLQVSHGLRSAGAPLSAPSLDIPK